MVYPTAKVGSVGYPENSQPVRYLHVARRHLLQTPSPLALLDSIGISILRLALTSPWLKGEVGGGPCPVRADDGVDVVGWNVVEKLYHIQPNTLKRCGLMTAETPPAWNVFKQIFAEHWDGFKRVYPRYDRRYYDGLVDKMLGCGDPDQMGYIEYRCLQCGEGTHRVAMSCKSSLCLRCAKVYVDNWVSQVSQMLHEGVIYRHIVLTMPAMLRTTFYQQAKPC